MIQSVATLRYINSSKQDITKKVRHEYLKKKKKDDNNNQKGWILYVKNEKEQISILQYVTAWLPQANKTVTIHPCTWGLGTCGYWATLCCSWLGNTYMSVMPYGFEIISCLSLDELNTGQK